MTSSVSWQQSLTDDRVRQIRELVSAASAADGVAPVGDQVLRALAHDRTRHLVAVEDDGAGSRVRGYLNLAPADDDAPPMAEVVVHPDARRRGTAGLWLCWRNSPE